MEEYIMTIDEGTTSARAVLFNKDSEIIAICAKEFAQYDGVLGHEYNADPDPVTAAVNGYEFIKQYLK